MPTASSCLQFSPEAWEWCAMTYVQWKKARNKQRDQIQSALSKEQWTMLQAYIELMEIRDLPKETWLQGC